MTCNSVSQSLTEEKMSDSL